MYLAAGAVVGWSFGHTGEQQHVHDARADDHVLNARAGDHVLNARAGDQQQPVGSYNAAAWEPERPGSRREQDAAGESGQGRAGQQRLAGLCDYGNRTLSHRGGDMHFYLF